MYSCPTQIVYAPMCPPNQCMLVHSLDHLVQAVYHALFWKLGVGDPGRRVDLHGIIPMMHNFFFLSKQASASLGEMGKRALDLESERSEI